MANDEIISVILVFLSIVSEMFFYIYILKKCVRDYAVYELCGARKSRVLLVNYLVLAVFFMFQYGIGYILFKTLILKIISETEPMITAVIDNRCYLYAFIILGVTFSVIFIFVMNNISKYQLRNIVLWVERLNIVDSLNAALALNRQGGVKFFSRKMLKNCFHRKICVLSICKAI